MNFLSPLYGKVIRCSKPMYTPFYFSICAFVASTLLPITTEILFAPMALAKRTLAWRFILGATLFLALLGTVGHYLNNTLHEPMIMQIIDLINYQWKIQTAVVWFTGWGAMFIFIEHFTIIPFKIFTVIASLISMAFILTVLIGHRLRLLVAVIGGEKVKIKLSSYIDVIGRVTILVTGFLYFIFQY